VRSAFILAKYPRFFSSLIDELRHAGFQVVTAEQSAMIPIGDDRAIFYDRNLEPSHFERYELPNQAAEIGFQYGFLVECRNEQWFCEMIRSVGNTLDIMVCDSDGNLFFPSTIRADSLVL